MNDTVSLRSDFSLNINWQKRWTTRYTEIKDNLKSGDIILVHGKYKYSWLAELLSWSKWTHCAMVLLAKDIDPTGTLNLPPVLLWESNVDDMDVPNCWPPHNGQVKEGPMLIPLEDRLKNTSTGEDVEIVLRKLYIPNGTPPWQSLGSYFDKVIDYTFPNNWDVLKMVWLGRTREESSKLLPFVELDIDPSYKMVNLSLPSEAKNLTDLADITKMFCSQLVADTFKYLGILTSNHVSNGYIPKDFSGGGWITLLESAFLGDEIYIDMSK